MTRRDLEEQFANHGPLGMPPSNRPTGTTESITDGSPSRTCGNCSIQSGVRTPVESARTPHDPTYE